MTLANRGRLQDCIESHHRSLFAPDLEVWSREAKVLAISAAKIVVKIFSNINQTLSLAALMLHAKNPNTVERCYFYSFILCNSFVRLW